MSHQIHQLSKQFRIVVVELSILVLVQFLLLILLGFHLFCLGSEYRGIELAAISSSALVVPLILLGVRTVASSIRSRMKSNRI